MPLNPTFWAISLKIRPLLALYPPPYIFLLLETVTIERGKNDVGMSIPPPVTPESKHREQSLMLQLKKALFYTEGGGYNTANFTGYYPFFDTKYHFILKCYFV